MLCYRPLPVLPTLTQTLAFGSATSLSTFQESFNHNRFKYGGKLGLIILAEKHGYHLEIFCSSSTGGSNLTHEMADTEEEKTMPLELAIQRELAYRRKIAALRLHPNDKPIKEVIPSSQASQPMPLPGPSSIPIASPCLPGTKRKEPTSSANHEPLQHEPRSSTHHPPLQREPISNTTHYPPRQHEPRSSTHHPPLQHEPISSTTHPSLLQYEPRSSTHHPPLQNPRDSNLSYKPQTDNLYCKICLVTCSSPFNLKQHLRGHKHRAKVQEQEFMQKAGTENKSNQRHWCELCKIVCMNEDLLQMHFRGQKHQAEVKKLQISKQGGVIPNQRKWCELCNIWCIDEFAFGQHLQGKKHILQLHTMEIEKTAIEEEDIMALNGNIEWGRRSHEVKKLLI